MHDWNRDGLTGPVRALHPWLAASLAARLQRELALAEDWVEGPDYRYYKSHLVFETVDFVAHAAGVVDVARSLLGNHLLLWDSSVPLKRAGSGDRFTWHQDATYWGLEPPDRAVTVWVALSDVPSGAGALRYVPGSHRGGPRAHRQNPEPGVMLRRGQRVDDVDEDGAVTVELEAGEAVAHHPLVLHASAPNRSPYDRLGVACVYVSDEVRAPDRQDSAQLVLGRARRSRFAPEERLDATLSERARRSHREALERMATRVVGPGGTRSGA